MANQINDWKEVPIDDWQEVSVEAQPTQKAAPSQPSIPERLIRGAGRNIYEGVTGIASLGKTLFNLPSGSPEGTQARSDMGNILQGAKSWVQGAGEAAREAMPFLPGNPSMTPEEKKAGKEAFSETKKLLQNPLDYMIDNPVNTALAVAPYLGAARKAAGLNKLTSAQEIARSAKAEKIIDSAVKEGMSKGVAPGVKTMKTAPQVAEYYDKAKEGIMDIVQNKDNLQLTSFEGNPLPASSLPKTNYEFAQAIDQSKRRVWRELDGMKKAAEGKGVEVGTHGVATELRTFAAQPWVQYKYSRLAEDALQRAKILDDMKTVDLDFVENIVKDANAKNKAFHANPNYQGVSEIALDELEAMHFRKAMDEAISSTEGQGFQALKNKYGSYLHIEKDVNHRANITDRQRPNGFWGYGDILSGSEMAGSLALLMSGNLPGAATLGAKGLAMKGIKEWIKHENAPDTSITRMFKKVDRASKGLWTPFDLILESTEGYDLPAPGQLAKPVGEPYGASNLPAIFESKTPSTYSPVWGNFPSKRRAEIERMRQVYYRKTGRYLEQDLPKSSVLYKELMNNPLLTPKNIAPNTQVTVKSK